jgi:hypothetical protein
VPENRLNGAVYRCVELSDPIRLLVSRCDAVPGPSSAPKPNE